MNNAERNDMEVGGIAGAALGGMLGMIPGAWLNSRIW